MAKLIVAAIFLLIPSLEAHAVIPSLLSPLQGLISVLPQLLLLLVATLGAIFSLRIWRERLSRLRAFMKAHKFIALAISAALIGGMISGAIVLAGRSAPDLKGKIGSDGEFPKAWPTFRGDLKRTGNPGDLRGPINPRIAWRFRDSEFRAGDFSSSPALAEGKIFVGSAQGGIFSSFGVVYCLNDKGELIWKFKTRRQIFSSPAVVGGRVYIGEGLHRDTDSKLYCLDAKDGKLLWDFQTKSHVESSPTVSDGKVLFGAGEDGVYCLDAETGEMIWHFEGIHVDLSPAVADGKVLVGTGYGEMGVYCLDLETGELIWRHRTEYPVWGSPSVDGGRVFVGMGNSNFVESSPEPYGALLCLDLNSGRRIWIYEVGDSVLTAPALKDGRVYFGSRDGHLYCLDADRGELIWKFDAGAPVLSSPALGDDLVYSASENGRIFALGREEGDLKWAFDLGLIIPGVKILSSPAVAGGRIYIGCSKGVFLSIGGTGDDG